jgi:ferredoxin
VRVTVDATKCEGYGACVDICPSVFNMDDWGYVATTGDGTVPDGEEKAVLKAISLCPENAIRHSG